MKTSIIKTDRKPELSQSELDEDFLFSNEF